MNRRTRNTHPGRPFALALLALTVIVLCSYLRDAAVSSGTDGANVLLSKRSSDAFSVEVPESCRHVHRYKDQCDFIKKNCADEESGLLSYLDLYFCKMQHAKAIAFIIIALWTAFLFTFIGIAASDFFCINLSTISNILGMSESMAGVTFLAFGNGSPDVFSTFAAIKSNSGSLAVGELIGAAGFITAVVSGSMALVRPFKVAAKSFVRDVSFFIVSIAFSMWFLANGTLTIWESVVMVAFYIFYVIFVCIWHWWLARNRKKRERESAIRGHYTIPGDDFEGEGEYRDDPDEDSGSRRSYAAPVSSNDLNELERAGYDGVTEFPYFDDEEARGKWMGELSSNMRIAKPPAGERAIPTVPIRPSLVGALEFRAVLASLQKSRNLQSLPISMRRYSDAPVSNPTDDIASTVSDPERTPYLVDVSEPAQISPSASTAALDASRTGRIRSVSANDAAGLNIDHDALSDHRVSNVDLFSQSPTQSDAGGFVTTPNLESTQGLQPPTSAPLLAVSGPSSGALRPADLMQEQRQNAPRSRTMDFLAPPDDHAARAPRRTLSDHVSTKNKSENTSYSHVKSQRPPLRLSSSPKHSPSHSPFLNGVSSGSPSRTTSFQLPPPGASSGSLFPNDEPVKHLSWWPYSILPSPQIIARTLFPTLYGWCEKTWWERCLGIASAPCFLFLTLTLPIVEPSKNASESYGEPEHADHGTATRDFAKSPSISVAPPPPQPHSTTATTAIGIETNDEADTASAGDDVDVVATHTSIATSTNKEWNRWLVMVQCFTAPYIVVVTVWANTSANPRDLIRPTLWSLLGSLLALLFILTTTTPTRPPKWHFILCFAGFVVAITWISTIAEEVVGVLKTIGVIFNISDAILGLTIFAVGNSLGDLVADITVARLGFPVMALSACFGGPMLNILLGIGLSGIYATFQGAQKHKRKHPDEPMKFKPYHIHVNTTLLISAVALLITLVGLLIVVPLNHWRMDKRIGWGLIILWLIATVSNVVVEVTGVIGDTR